VLCIYFSFSRSAPQSAQPGSVLPFDLLSGSGHSAKELARAENSSFRSFSSVLWQLRAQSLASCWCEFFSFWCGLLQELVPVVFLSRRIKRSFPNLNCSLVVVPEHVHNVLGEMLVKF
jgi:hypothetical protein